MSQPAVEMQRQTFALVVLKAAPADQPRDQTMANLNENFPQHEDIKRGRPARHAAAKLAQGTFDAPGGVVHVTALELQLAQLAFDFRLRLAILSQHQSRFELDGGLVIAATQHEHLAEPLGDQETSVDILRPQAASGD